MQTIKNKKEFEGFYPYAPKYKPTTYPKEYPCVVKWEYEERGIMGDEKIVYVAYFPKNLTMEQAFIEGLEYKWIMLKN